MSVKDITPVCSTAHCVINHALRAPPSVNPARELVSRVLKERVEDLKVSFRAKMKKTFPIVVQLAKAIRSMYSFCRG